jgi:hypothetical protein
MEMKTSTKIFMGVAAAVVAFSLVNALWLTVAIHKKYEPAAQHIANILDTTPIRVLEITQLPMEPVNGVVTYPFSLGTFNIHDPKKQMMNISISTLENIRIEGDTMFIDNLHPRTPKWRLLSSPSLETVIIHYPDRPDQVINLMEERMKEQENPERPEEHWH